MQASTDNKFIDTDASI